MPLNIVWAGCGAVQPGLQTLRRHRSELKAMPVLLTWMGICSCAFFSLTLVRIWATLLNKFSTQQQFE